MSRIVALSASQFARALRGHDEPWRTASCSSGLKGHVQKFGWGFSVFEAFGNHSKRQRLDASHCFVAVGAIAHDSGQRWYFGQPPAVLFALKLDGKRHPCTVASAPAG